MDIDKEIDTCQQTLQLLQIQILQANPTYQWWLSRQTLLLEIKTGKTQEELLQSTPVTETKKSEPEKPP